MHVLGTGPTTATWAIVGEAPGATEDRDGLPFVGRSGQLLRKSLQNLGLDPADAYITNVVKVRPPNNATPTAKEIREAAPDLAAELAALPNLRAVLLLGNTALSAVSGAGGVTKRRGIVSTFREDFREHDPSYFATLHPAMILRNNNYEPDWKQDLASFKSLVDSPKEEIHTVLIERALQVPMLRAALSSPFTHAALDIETTIPGEGEDTLICVGLTLDGDTVFVLTPEMFRTCAPMLRDIEWVMHNGAYDRGWLLEHEGIDLILTHDTMAMQYLINSDERKSLQYLSSRYLGLPPYKDVDYKNILDEPFDKVARMNATDVARTYKLFRPLADEMNASPKLSRLYQWILMPAVNTLIEVTRNGVPIDADNLKALTDRLCEEDQRLETSLMQHVDNPRSTQQVARYLYEECGLPVLQRTDTGNPSTATAVLQELQSLGGCEKFLADLLSYRKVSKQLSAFLNAWPNFIEQGKMHPEFKPLRVVTGRLSSANPNIQQVPRDSDFRNVFGGVEGHTWIKADYSQIELRVAAWLAGEENMIAAYQEGADLHALTAERVLGDASARQVGKVLNFGLLYGASANKLREIAAQQYGLELTDKEARHYHNEFFRVYPAFGEWHTDVAHDVTRTGKSSSPLGRVRWLPNARSWDDGEKWQAIREGINHPVQGFASDLMLHAVNDIHSLYPEYIVAIVHDEVDLVVPDEYVDQVVFDVREIMEDTTWLRRFGVDFTVPLVADIETGTHWGNIS